MLRGVMSIDRPLCGRTESLPTGLGLAAVGRIRKSPGHQDSMRVRTSVADPSRPFVATFRKADVHWKYDARQNRTDGPVQSKPDPGLTKRVSRTFVV